jgi:hypothetical protein
MSVFGQLGRSFREPTDPEYSGEGDRSFRLNVTDYSGLT